ncbi:uncharacterized protein LOC144537387 [Sander vitreus]
MLPVDKLPDSEKQTVKNTISVNQLLLTLEMSADIHAPDLSLNMREEEENQAKIYENEDTLKQSLRSCKVRPLTRNNPSAVKRCPFGAKAVILGVLYLLILGGIYMRYVVATLETQNLMTEREQLNISLIQLTISLNQLNTTLIQLTISLNQLNTTLIETQTRNINLAKEKRQLEARCYSWRSRDVFPKGGIDPLK